MLPLGPKLQTFTEKGVCEPKDTLRLQMLPGGWGLAQQPHAEGRLGQGLVMTTEHAVLMAILADAFQGLYGDARWL